MIPANKITLSAEQKAYLIENFDKVSRGELASYFGMSLVTLRRKAKELGLSFHPWRSPECLECIVRENIDKMSFNEIKRKFGVSSVSQIAHRLGLEQSAELKERLRLENLQRLRASKKDFKAIAAKCKRLRKMDELRVMSGLPQKTKFKIKTITKKSYKAKWWLIKQYGYYACDGEPYTLLYDETTKRMPFHETKKHTERYYTEKYGLCFEKAE